MPAQKVFILLLLCLLTPVTWARSEDQRLSSKDLITVARQAGEYLVRMNQPDGKFIYLFDAAKNAAANDYNVLRHAGTTYSLMELYALTKESFLSQAAKRAIKYIDAAAKPSLVSKDSGKLLVEAGSFKMGANGLAGLAIVEYQKHTGDRSFQPLLQQLMQGILDYQRVDGSFVSKIYYPSGKDSGFVSAYYPGEAIFALMRSYFALKDQRYLEAAKKGANYLIDVRDKAVEDSKLPHDHWLLYALNELHRAVPDKKYVDHAGRIVGAILKAQLIKDVPTAWIGGFDRPPRSSPAATRSEGLLAAYEMFSRASKTERLGEIESCVTRGITFQLRTFIDLENAKQYASPSKVVGGFREGLDQHTIRIDTVQHNLSSLIGYIRNFHPGFLFSA